MQAGVSPKLTVLYLPDYVTSQTRMSKTSQSWIVLGQMFPEYEVKMPLASGPFQDDEGVCSFFDRTRSANTVRAEALNLKRDLLTSAVLVARTIRAHRPDFLLADGQGALE